MSKMSVIPYHGCHINPGSRPMKVRLGLRKHWENPNAAAQEALNTLIELLGYQVHVEVDSAQLWSDLEKFYPDPETFAPNITTVIQTWAECLTARLQDDANAVWTEKFLGMVTERGTVVRAHVEVSLPLPLGASDPPSLNNH